MIWWTLLAVGWFLAALWVAGGVPMVRFLKRARLEDRTETLPDPEPCPPISVVVAARNEEDRIEQALRSLARLDYPTMEIIAVNDRSRDGTGEIIDKVSAEEPSIEAVHVSTLPEYWLGKCHALHLGAKRASGELLLFTDGDVAFAPETLKLAVRYLAARELDHLVLFPGVTPRGYWEDALKSFFAMAYIMGTRAWAVSKKSKNVFVGAGAFNLVRRSAYDGIGGHESLRMEVVDDLMLGKRIKEEGFQQDVLIAPKHLELTWLEGVGGFIHGLEKNAFAGVKYSVLLLLLITLLMAVVYSVPYLGVLAFRDARIWGYVATILIMHTVYGYTASSYRNGWRLAPALPIVAFIYLWTFWRSALVTLRQRGIRWRETFYPLEDLKRDHTNQR